VETETRPQVSEGETFPQETGDEALEEVGEGWLVDRGALEAACLVGLPEWRPFLKIFAFRASVNRSSVPVFQSLLLLLLADAQQWIGHLHLFSKVSGKVVVSLVLNQETWQLHGQLPPEIVLKSLAFLEWQELVFFVVERPRVTEPSEVLHSFQPSNSKNNTSRNSQTKNASHRKFENAILLKQS